GGADLIDVKEPSRGSLGQADLDVLEAIVSKVDRRTPVSAALGEWIDWIPGSLPAGVSFVKWGLSRMAKVPDPAIFRLIGRHDAPKPVLVAYADHARAESPMPCFLAQKACEHSFSAFLIDTSVKDGTSVLDWIEPAALARIRYDLADAGVRVAFAGSLDAAAIRHLLPLAPDWFAVRGAACIGGRQ